jgi:hypothetical protein
MPRCYFHVQEGNTVHHDDEGQECAGIESMEREAMVTAASIVRDHALQGRYCSVFVKVKGRARAALADRYTLVKVERH